MSFTVNDVLTESQNLLNDASGTLFTDTVLQPFFDKSYSELNYRLELADVNTNWEEVGSPITIAASTVQVTYTPLPADFYSPIELHEKAPGENDSFYTLMVRTMWLPDRTIAPYLTWWTYREETITFLGASQDRVVRLRYNKIYPVITGVGDTVVVNNSKTFLAARTAALAAFAIGENETRASALNQDAISAIDMIVRLSNKNRQVLRTRRRAFAINRGYLW